MYRMISGTTLGCTELRYCCLLVALVGWNRVGTGVGCIRSGLTRWTGLDLVGVCWGVLGWALWG